MQKDKPPVSTYWLIAIIFMVVKLLLHFLTNTRYELHRDEMLYFNMADHLSAGYATVPPMIGFLAFMVKSIFGYSVFGIRFIPALLGAASIFMMAKIIRELGGGILALIIAASAFLLSTGFLLFDTLFTPNVVEHFFWLLIAWLVSRLIKTGDHRLWPWIGFVIGLAFMNKYSVAFPAIGFFIAILLSSHRYVFASKYFFYAIIIGIIIIIPNIAWQYLHGWPVIHHIDELKRTQMVNMGYFDYLTDIYSLNSLSTIIWLFGLGGLLFLKAEKTYRYLGVASLIIIILFMFSGGKGYYIMGLLPFLFAAGGYLMEKYFTRRPAYMIYTILAITTISSLLALPFGLPMLSPEKLNSYSRKTNQLVIYPFSRWEDGVDHKISQVYADMTGWKELVSYVNKAYCQLSEEEKATCTIYAERNYGYAGAVHFYGKEYTLPDAVTFLDSYTLWAPDTVPLGPFIYINYDTIGFHRFFKEITELGAVDNIYFREQGVRVFLCKIPEMDFREVYRQKAIEAKNTYR